MDEVMDQFDQATEQEMNATAIAIGLARMPVAPIAATGICLWCSDPLELSGARWCSPECRDDWSKRNG
jgi:hypothetical protein